MPSESPFPATLYGCNISYFTGKLENYFRVKGIPYRMQPLTQGHYAPLLGAAMASTRVTD